MAHAGGRPTKYKEEYCDKIIAYFTVQPQQTVYKRTYFADGQLKSEEPIVLPEQLPTFEKFADIIGVHKDTLYEWGKEHKEFSDSLMRAKQLQEHIWLVNGMSNLYNSQFAQFFGKNCLGYRDKMEVESKVESENINHNINYDDTGAAFVRNCTDDERERFLVGDMTDREKEHIALRK